MSCYLIVIDIWNAAFPKRCKIEGKSVLITSRKSYMSFRLVPKSVTLNDLNSKMAFILRYFLPNFLVSGRIA